MHFAKEESQREADQTCIDGNHEDAIVGAFPEVVILFEIRLVGQVCRYGPIRKALSISGVVEGLDNRHRAIGEYQHCLPDHHQDHDQI